MANVYAHIMTVSIAMNCCLISYNIFPRVESKLLSCLPSRWTLTRLVAHLQDKPQVLAKIITNQLMIGILIIASAVAICTSDILMYPFHPQTIEKWNIQLTQVIFSINIGRYMFNILEPLFSKQYKKKARYLVENVHHVVTLLCYSLFLGYTENSLLGLVGVLMESTCIFEDVVRLCNTSNMQQTLLYKRLLLLGAVFNVCFRGIVPVAFLINAMFHQSPFTMSYPTLMVFFLSIVFFSVINVWQILASFQRFLKFTLSNNDVFRGLRDETAVDDTTWQTNGRERGLLFSKNNLGYTRPYDNKNFSVNNYDAKANVENRKVTAKDTIELQIDPVSFIIKTMSSSCSIEHDKSPDGDLKSRLYVNTKANCENDVKIITTTNHSVNAFNDLSPSECPIGVPTEHNYLCKTCPSPMIRVFTSSKGFDTGTSSTDTIAHLDFRMTSDHQERTHYEYDSLCTVESSTDTVTDLQTDIAETSDRRSNDLRNSSSSTDSSASDGTLMPLSPVATSRKHLTDPESHLSPQLHNVRMLARSHIRRSVPCDDLSKVTSLHNSFKLDPVCHVATVSLPRFKLQSFTFDA
ncbi:uncharacterized protein LOC127838747 [Dreissena polymorpha]|uniref:TLC domain-containing protein n=1 Tax=Dreissena polymorpha TaxID=45954 RepID=A0A9D4F5C2_DREPO|nr:uncharacterized protein LOC127838747 [Dreissena polymorpha]XP_052222688.1 uncharacterized protein LOC127838747 [Dreissena polymorpha]XP_052222689.1 uncharacterized protein LOC127838747 [Dreissena polymorpha]XP_052222690.1 uncharacterized protein LOC127838747 [Dreissena polymorpha]KAH3791626.1 hypothetical protein DPMN_145114 [Dreissena polymorpha]